MRDDEHVEGLLRRARKLSVDARRDIERDIRLKVKKDVLSWGVILGWILFWDIKLTEGDKETRTYRRRSLSRIYWDILDSPWLGPIAVGVMSAVVYHLIHKPKGH